MLSLALAAGPLIDEQKVTFLMKPGKFPAEIILSPGTITMYADHDSLCRFPGIIASVKLQTIVRPYGNIPSGAAFHESKVLLPLITALHLLAL